MPKCIEMYDGQSFCCEGDAYSGVDQREWHFISERYGSIDTEAESVAAIKKADCPDCLRRLALLGRTAQAVLDQAAAAKA